MRAAFISNSDCGRHDTGWGHPEHVGRLRAITRALRQDFDLFQSIEHVEGRHATADDLALVHDPGYIARLSELIGELEGLANLNADTVVSSGSYDAATAAAGCVLEAVD